MPKILIILIPLLVIVLIVVSVLYINSRNELAQISQGEVPGESTPNFWELTEYPSNLFEGTVVSLGAGEFNTMVVNVNASKIVPEAGNLEKTVRINADTEFVFHEVTPESDRQMQLSEIKVGDYVVVATKESVREEIMTRNTFTATRITKIRVELPK